MIKKIFISGSGGQGIRLMSFVLSKIISELDYNVSLMFDYDAAMRGGSINAFLIYSDEKLGNPLIEEADIHIKLSDASIEAKRVICEKGLCGDEQVAFKEIAKKEFGNIMVRKIGRAHV